MIEVGIVGGGPGGLLGAWHLDRKCAELINVTVMEATDRLGGKLLTRRFSESGTVYEAGVAEIYDYSDIGPDPLAGLIQELGLSTVPMDSNTVVMHGRILPDLAAVEEAFGKRTRREIEAFRRFCAAEISPLAYYESLSKEDNGRVCAKIRGDRLLYREVKDAAARTYLRCASHSDIAAPLHLTNGLNTIKNILMDVDGYIRISSIEGGIECLTQRLAEVLLETRAANFLLRTLVTHVGLTNEGRYRVTALREGRTETREFDVLILALPLNWLSTIQWEGEELERAMVEHIAHFDRPGHYLRVSVLFDSPFWRDMIRGSWWMSDAFNGCCVYDEGARHDLGGKGVLGWLIAGNDALAMANLDDATLVERVLDTLPDALQHGRPQLREAAVHRWVSAVNAVPGGYPCRDIRRNHLPEPDEHPALFVVGDYIFDATLNGVLDSADAATDMALSHIVSLHTARAKVVNATAREPSRMSSSRRIGPEYFDNYRGLGPYAQAWRIFFDPNYLAELARAAWGLQNGFSILDAGSASGLTVKAMRDIGLEAWGIEKDIRIHRETPENVRSFNLLGDVGRLPFPEDHFDVVYETCLAHLSGAKAEKALSELHRVARKGVIFGSVTSELAVAALGRHDLLGGVKRLGTWWEWSELFFDHDFDLALGEPERLAAAWQVTLQHGRGPGQWFEDEESLRYSLYTKIAD